MTAARVEAAAVEVERASTLELFLDLVFVFTVTQLTALVEHPHGLRDYGQAALILIMTFWMYDGYVWLTGNLRLRRVVNRIGILAGMACFLLMAIAIPGVFGATDAAADTGAVFGLAYLAVTLIHGGMFATAPTSSALAIRRIAPFNLAGAGFVMAAGFVDPDLRWLCWLAAVASIASSTLFGVLRGWALSASHFVERHGLVIIVTLGESIVAIGVGASGLEIDAALAATAVLALALSATMWWLYFDRDDEAAVAVMSRTAGDGRGRLGMWFAYSHLVMVAGIVMTASGIKPIVSHPTTAAEAAPAWNLAAGIAVYLIGDLLFRHSLALGRPAPRLAAAALILLTVPIGTRGSGLAQLAAAVVLMLVLVAGESRRASPARPEPDA